MQNRIHYFWHKILNVQVQFLITGLLPPDGTSSICSDWLLGLKYFFLFLVLSRDLTSSIYKRRKNITKKGKGYIARSVRGVLVYFCCWFGFFSFSELEGLEDFLTLIWQHCMVLCSYRVFWTHAKFDVQINGC